jgi:hypothetical protein
MRGNTACARLGSVALWSIIRRIQMALHGIPISGFH